MNHLPLWRVAAAFIILAGLLFFAALFAPIYFHNLQLQNFVADIAARPDMASKPDDVLRDWVLDKAHELSLPVQRDNVKIVHSREGMRIDVRYLVQVNFPGYTVNLHFYPGAGSK